MLFSCAICDIHTPNRADYKKHIQTMKHCKNVLKVGVATVDDNTSGDDNSESTSSENEIVLNITDISNNSKRGYNRFSIPKKTKPTYNKTQQCKYCGLGYSYSSGLYRHMKICIGKTQETNSNTMGSNMNIIINTLLHENKEFKQMIMDVMKTNNEILKSNQELLSSQQDTTNKVLELCKSNSASVTNNIYNHQGDNNHFSINVFLNEKCKDAMNMTDFVNSIAPNMKSVETVGERGYVEGISSIFIDNLKNTEINKRPIHCSDKKREILYVKDDDCWEREDANSQKLKNAVLIVGHKHAVLVNKWADEHPGCEKSYGRDNDRFMNICRHVSDADDTNILKVVKNIARETVIDKGALI